MQRTKLPNCSEELLSSWPWLTGQLPSVNVFNCINVRQGISKTEHARSANSFYDPQRLKTFSHVSLFLSLRFFLVSQALCLPGTLSPPVLSSVTTTTFHCRVLSSFVSAVFFSLNGSLFSLSVPSVCITSSASHSTPFIHHCTIFAISVSSYLHKDAKKELKKKKYKKTDFFF